MRLFRFWALFVALLLVVGAMMLVQGTAQAAPASDEVSAAGRTYFVAPDGRDSNPGTVSQPWRTISKAASVLNAGDVVYIKNGQYRENVRLDWRNRGKPGQPIAYRAYPGHRPVLDGTGVSTANLGLFELTGCDHIEISGLTIRNSPKAGIHVRGSEGLTVKENVIERAKSSGIAVWRSSDVVVVANKLVDCRIDPQAGGHMLTIATVAGSFVGYNEVYWTDQDCCGSTAALAVKHGSTQAQVRGNWLHDLPATGIYIDAWDQSTHDLYFDGNLVRNATTGISLGSERGGTLSNVHIYNNTIHHSKFAGIRMQDVAQNGRRENIYIYNNTIVGSYGHGGAGILIATYNVRNVWLINNLINFGPDTTVGQIKAFTPSAITSVTNLVYGPRDPVGDSRLVEITQGTITADPRFLDGASGNFHLRADSPARDRGSQVDLDHDYDGVRRPRGSGYDIGAYEYWIVGPMNERAFLPVVVR